MSISSYVTPITVQNDRPLLYVQFCASLDRTTREQCLPEGGLGVRVLRMNLYRTVSWNIKIFIAMKLENRAWDVLLSLI